MAKNAHERIIAKVAKEVGLPERECNFIVYCFYRAVRYIVQRPWIIPGDTVLIFDAFRFQLNPDLLIRHGFWDFPDTDTKKSMCRLLDQIQSEKNVKKYNRLRHFRVEYYKKQKEEVEAQGKEVTRPKPRDKTFLKWQFITKQQARKIAREVASRSLT